MFKSKSNTKSPLKAKPLRLPGQSLDEQLSDYLLDKLLFPYMLALLFWTITGLEWWRYYRETPPSPWFFTIVSICLTIYAATVIQLRWKYVKQLKLGRDGERAVGQYLERLAADGYRVFHDVITGDSNIDHVVVGPTGVFTVETKTISKPPRGQTVITVAADMVMANGKPLERNPLVQGKAQARWLKNFLDEAQFPSFVQPVVAFPGWYVEPCNHQALGIWALEPKAIPHFIKNENRRLSDDEVKAIYLALSSFVRSNAAN